MFNPWPSSRTLPRPHGRPDRLLGLTAEALLGAQLVVRHRSPRVALAIAVCVAVMMAAADAWVPADPERIARKFALAVGLAGGVAGVAGTRLFTPGAALHSARYAALSVRRAVLGRALGAAGMLAAPGAALLLVLAPSAIDAGAVAAVLAAQGAAIALSAGLVPTVGVMPGGVLSVALSLAVVTRPALVATPLWPAAGMAVSALGLLLATLVIRRGPLAAWNSR